MRIINACSRCTASLFDEPSRECHDCAVMEVFSSLQSELDNRFDKCVEAKMKLFDYIEVFCNHRRRRSTIGAVSATGPSSNR